MAGVVPQRRIRRARAKEIAEKLTHAIYRHVGIARRADVVVYLDQRGTHRRAGEPQNIPLGFQKAGYPALVFRPTSGRASPYEVLSGEAWDTFRGSIKHALGDALGHQQGPTPMKVHLLGHAQLALPFFLGHSLFSRNTRFDLFCTNLRGQNPGPFSNEGQERNAPLSGGNARCEADLAGIPRLSGETAAVSLLLFKEGPHLAPYVRGVLDYLKAHPGSPPPVLVTHGDFQSNAQVMNYIKDIVALLLRLRTERGVRA